jgi:DNA-binding transcriptional ArsR family regulator
MPLSRPLSEILNVRIIDIFMPRAHHGLMEFSQKAAKAMLLSPNEKAVLKCIPDARTPLLIADKTGIPRPTVYITLSRLKKRGLLTEIKEGKKKYWIPDSSSDFETETESKAVRIYTDPKEIGRLYERFVTDGEHRLKTILGNNCGEPWRKIIGEDEIVRLNRIIKKRKTVCEVVSSMKVYDDHARNFGKHWIESYTDRPFRVSIIDPKYLDHAGQVFVYGKKMLLINMKKPVVIEISDPELIKMMVSVGQFFHDHIDPTNIDGWLKEYGKR